MGKTHLAPGFRFHPTDAELVRYYLKRKVMGKKLLADAIAEVDIYKFEPQDLPDKSYIRSGDLKWHFFCPRERKYSSGIRAKRATESGYWKTTGKERPVLCNNEVVGKIKTLVYHLGKSPRGERTDWVMHEYKLEDKALTEMNVPQDTYVVCVLFKKDGPGPRNGAQYGAPFKEEDWSDEEEEQTHLPATENPKNLPGSSKETSLVVTASHAPKDCVLGMISESCVSDFLPAATTRLPSLSNAPDNNDDDIYSLLDRFVADDEYLPVSEHTNNDIRTEADFSGVREAPISLEESIFSGLPDLSNMLNNIPTTPSYSYDLVENSEFYLELQDLTAPLTPLPTTAQNTNLNDPRTSQLNQSSHYMGFSAAADGGDDGDDDPYGFAAAMGHGPTI